MDITFKYNGKIITTPNLEKKLKRMKLRLSDIEIIEAPIKKTSDNGVEDYMLDKEMVVVLSNLDNIRRICYVPKGTRPPIGTFINKWNLYSDWEIENMYYE